MPNPRLAARYAKSIIDLCVEQNSLDETLADMQYLSGVCNESKDFTNLLRSPVINADKKHRIIDAVVGAKLKPLSKAFVNLLINKGREENLPEIAEAFIQQYKDLKNIKTVTVTTATPMSDSVKQAIMTQVVAALPEASIEMKEEVREEIIGGFVLQMGDKLFDASIRRDLNDVKKQFAKNIYVSQLR